MKRVAKKVLIVLCMLVVTTAQLYSSAFAMPMDTGSSSTFKTHASQAHASQTHTSQAHASQPHASHVMHTNENVQTVDESCCELIATEKNNQCTSMTNGTTPEKSSGHHCDEMANCAQAHCVNPATASLSIYFFYMKAFSASHIAINYLLIDQHGSSLYRPPIFR
ncbi:hypothetical protein [Neptunomonas sp.]|uniref:hypothetical protein n=1 Tax=Neptunomonas sp. TaxID=1971898 RepID=UPI0035684ADF